LNVFGTPARSRVTCGYSSLLGTFSPSANLHSSGALRPLTTRLAAQAILTLQKCPEIQAQINVEHQKSRVDPWFCWPLSLGGAAP